MAGSDDDAYFHAAAEVDRLVIVQLYDAIFGELSLEQGRAVIGDGDLRLEHLAGPLQVAAVVGVVVRDGRDANLGVFSGGEVAAKHPAIAVDRLSGIDREGLTAFRADEVDGGEVRVHRILIRHLDCAHAGRNLHAA